MSILIFILPIAKEWNTLLFGDRVTGTVIAQRKFAAGGIAGSNDFTIRCAIQYKKGDDIFTVYGPENIIYKIGKKIPLVLSKNKPTKFIIATFSGFYIQYRSVWLIIVFILWLAIYTTIVQFQKGKS